MKAININDMDAPYTEYILSGRKDIETREKNTLKSLVGQRVGIIRTGCGTAMLCGYVTIIGVGKYETEGAFRMDEARHLVKPGSKYDIKPGKSKYGYVLANPERCSPMPVHSKGIVIRNI